MTSINSYPTSAYIYKGADLDQDLQISYEEVKQAISQRLIFAGLDKVTALTDATFAALGIDKTTSISAQAFQSKLGCIDTKAEGIDDDLKTALISLGKRGKKQSVYYTHHTTPRHGKGGGGSHTVTHYAAPQIKCDCATATD